MQEFTALLMYVGLVLVSCFAFLLVNNTRLDQVTMARRQENGLRGKLLGSF